MVKGIGLPEDEADIRVTTTRTAEDFDEAQEIIQLALYGDGVYKKETAPEHTITYKMTNADEISAEEAQSYKDASFSVEVNHKTDGSIDIIISVDNSFRARHHIYRIF